MWKRHALETLEFNEEVQKLREKTFNKEFRDLVAKVVTKSTSGTIDTPEKLLDLFHQLYYIVLSKSFNNSVQFVDVDSYIENNPQHPGEIVSSKLMSLGFVENLILQYDFINTYFGILTNSVKGNFFSEFYLLPSDTIYNDIITQSEGILISYKSIRDDHLYSKRLGYLPDTNFHLWIFSTYHLVKKVISFLNINIPAVFELWCPIIMVKVHEKFSITSRLLNEIYYTTIVSIMTLLESYIIMNKSSLLLSSNYFHEVYKVFENFYYVSKSEKYTKYFILKSKYENQVIYCLFRYLLQKYKDKKSFSTINFRPMIGLIILFLTDEDEKLVSEAKNLVSVLNDYLELAIIDKYMIKNAVQLYRFIIET